MDKANDPVPWEPPPTNSGNSEPKPRKPDRSREHLHGCGVMFWILSLLVAAVFVFLSFVPVKLPPNALPWSVAKLDARPGMFTHIQINRLAMDRGSCLTALGNAKAFAFTRLADTRPGEGCGFTNVVRAERSPVAFNEQPVTTCALAAALYWWERDLKALAQKALGTSLKRIDQVGTYACRNVNSASSGPRSEHATANAIDVETFVMADGRRISVVKHWGKATPEGRFLAAAHDSACGTFNEVLGPDYNALHANHFHLDLGPYLMCR